MKKKFEKNIINSLGCFLLIFALVLCSTVNVFAKEDSKECNKLDENLSDYSSFEFAEEILFDNINEESIHLESCDGDFRYILDLLVSTPNENVRSNEEIKYGAGEFKCYYKDTIWVFTATLDATFHYNGTYVWATYGYYTYEYNTTIGFSQNITKNQYTSVSDKNKTKAKYVVKTQVKTNKYGDLGLHTFNLTCTPNGGLNITNTVS